MISMPYPRSMYRNNALDERVRRRCCIEPQSKHDGGGRRQRKSKCRRARQRQSVKVSRFYQVQLVADGKVNWYGNVAASRVAEDDLRVIIGERVSFTCFRDHTYTTCHSLLSLRHNGRELLQEAK